VTSPTILEFQPELVTNGFQRPDLTSLPDYYYKLFTSYSNLIVSLDSETTVKI